MTALVVRCELYLVHGDEVDVPTERHGLRGANPVVGAAWRAFLFARHQGDAVLTDASRHAVIDFARQQPERQADHAAAVAQHALDGEVGFAGVGGSQDGFDPGAVGHGRMVGLGLGEFKPGPSQTALTTGPVENWSIEENKNESLATQSI